MTTSSSGRSRLAALTEAFFISLGVLSAGGALRADSEVPDTPAAEPEINPMLATHESPFRVALEGDYLYGPIDGSLQTPSGGRPGTSSPGRPTLSELGIKDASAFDTQLTLGMGRNDIYLGGQFIHLHGNATLQEPLMSNHMSFPAGADVSSDVQLDWYRLAYRRWIPIDLDHDGKPEFAIAPSIGAALFVFDYKLSDPDNVSLDRHYSKPMPLVGLDVEWPISSRLSLVGSVLVSPPIQDTPFVLSGRLAGKYRVIDSRHVAVDALLGVGYWHVHYDDGAKQEVPNDINVNFGPQLVVGLQVTF
jgi:hypothetical protein